jgi:predicted DNA-binding transcriptional regulator YafY
MSYGGEIEVIEPLSLKNNIVDRLTKMVENYKK